MRHFRYVTMWLWVIVPVTMIAIGFLVGTPHFIVSYSFLDNGDRWNPYAERYYTSCSYMGWGGHIVTKPAVAGKCGWVRLFKSEAQS